MKYHLQQNTYPDRPIESSLIEFEKIDCYLQTIRQIIDERIINGQKQRLFENMVEAIETRRTSLDLNMAVVGQFSSGKSTFINGLIRQNLLKAKNEVTTASATFIRIALELSLTVTFDNDYVVEATEQDFDHLLFHMERFHFEELNERRDFPYFIELLTTNPQVTASIKRLEIGVPTVNTFLSNLVIIDTPGLFAGVDKAIGHEAITQSIIDNDADMAVILLPAHQVFSRTLIDFLNSLPHNLLKRCLFIVSRMDMLEEIEEQEEFLNVTNKMLRTALNLDNPPLFSCSAIAVLPEGKRIIPDDEELVHWQSSFVKLEVILKDILQNNKIEIISAKLKFLLRTLIDEIIKELKELDTFLEQQENDIEDNSVQTIDIVLGGLLNDAKSKTSEEIKRIKEIADDYYEYMSGSMKAAENKIDHAGSAIYDTYTTIEGELHRTIEMELEKLLRNINMGVGSLNKQCEALRKIFEKQFQANYKSFKFLSVNVNIDKIQTASLKLPPCNFSSYKDELIAKRREKDNGLTVGVVVGGVIGFLVGGPVGAAAGAAMGGAAGNKVSEEPLDTLKPRLKKLLKDEIENNFKSSARKIKSAVTKIETDINKRFNKICDDHKAVYGREIEILINEHNENKKQIGERKIAAAADLASLNGILNELNQSSFKFNSNGKYDTNQ